jgi:hypothetical protein
MSIRLRSTAVRPSVPPQSPRQPPSLRPDYDTLLHVGRRTIEAQAEEVG